MPKAFIRSVVWKFFDLAESRQFAVCRYCNRKYKFHGNTSNLKEHIKRRHPTEFRCQGDERAGIPPVFEQQEDQPVAFIIEVQNPSTSEDVHSEILENSVVSPQKAIKRKQQQQRRKQTPKGMSSIDEALVAMIVKGYHPLSIVESSGFRSLIQALNPHYTIPSKKTLSEKLLPTLCKLLNGKLLEALNTVDYISLSADYWKSNKNRSYLSITAHYIIEDKLHNSNLATKELEVTSPEANTASVIEEICNNFNILSKIVSVVTDNSENLEKAVADLNKHHHPCVAHIINLTVSDALSKDSELTSLLAKCRALVTHVKQSLVYSYKLKVKQIQLNLPQLKLKQDVTARWNSTYVMLQRLWEVKKSLVLVLADIFSEDWPDRLSCTDFAAVNDILHILRPFVDLTEEMSGDKYVTMSTINPLVRGLLHAIRSISPTTQIGQNLQKNILEMIQVRLDHLETDKTIAKATFLDPRFKKTGFAYEDNARNAQQWIVEELTEILRSQGESTECEQPERTDVMPTKNKKLSIWSLFDTQVTQQTVQVTANTTAHVMVRQYVETNIVNRKCDPLLFWKNHATIYPELYQLAKKYLSIPASSVLTDCIISKAGCILTDRRNSLSSKCLEEIVFLHSAMELTE